MNSKKNDAGKPPRMIDTPGYSGPDRRKSRQESSASHTSVRLRFDNNGRSLWEAVTEDPERRVDNETVGLLATLNDDTGAPDAAESSSGEDTVVRRMIVAT